MTKAKTALLTVGALFGGVIIGQVGPVRAQLGDILKGGVVLVAVDKLAGPIDKGINTLTGNQNTSVRETTKVVPILTVGGGTYVGAVQVSGPRNLVDQVKAVAQLEGQIRVGTDVRARALIPVSARSVTDLKSLSRVKGVGVSALVDIRL